MLLPAASNFILRGRRRKGGTSRQETSPPWRRAVNQDKWRLLSDPCSDHQTLLLADTPGTLVLLLVGNLPDAGALGRGFPVPLSLVLAFLATWFPWTLRGEALSLESFLIYFLQPCRYKTESNQEGPVFMSELEPCVYHFLAG